MPSTVEQLSPTRVKIAVEVPFDDLKPSLDKAYTDIAQQVNIPGFRKGKVPPLVIDQRFGRGVVLQEAINSALPGLYGQAIQDNELVPMGEPDIEMTKLEDGELIEFTAEVDVRPDFELPDLDDLAVTVDPVEATEDRVDEQVEVLRERFGTLHPVERAAAEGDVLVLSLVATKDGEALEDATADDLSYTVGSGGMLDGLDEAVTGLSAGESATFASELVGGPLRGEAVDVEVTVSKVQERELPEADDEFAQLASEFDTIEEMRADLAGAVEGQARIEQANKARESVLESLIAKADFEVPAGALEGEVTARKQQIDQQLAQAGLTLEKYLAESEDENETPEEFYAEVEKRAGDALKAQILLDKVADAREVGVDQNDLTQYLMQRAQQAGTDPQQEAQHMMDHNHISEYMADIRRSKALASLLDSATITDTNGESVDFSRLMPDGSIAEEAPAEEAADEAVEETGEVAPEADSAEEEQANA